MIANDCRGSTRHRFTGCSPAGEHYASLTKEITNIGQRSAFKMQAFHAESASGLFMIGDRRAVTVVDERVVVEASCFRTSWRPEGQINRLADYGPVGRIPRGPEIAHLLRGIRGVITVCRIFRPDNSVGKQQRSTASFHLSSCMPDVREDAGVENSIRIILPRRPCSAFMTTLFQRCPNSRDPCLHAPDGTMRIRRESRGE